MALKEVLRYIPQRFRNSLCKLPHENIQELRLRINKPFGVVVLGKERYLTNVGTLTEDYNEGVFCTKQDILQSFDSVCNHSVHSYARELSQGYITIEGGNRVGLCGTYVYKGNEIHTVKEVSSLNFRLANQVLGCAEPLYHLADFSTPKGLLIIGKPLSAKTTTLRDLCRLLGNRYKVSLVDERSEIASVYNGIPQNDVGLKVDVFNDYPKSIAINSAVRTMSPDVIICDEIGTSEDFKAVISGGVCGVKFICTAHAESIQQVMKLETFRELFNTHAFDYVALLGTGENIGKVLEFKPINF
jgi:stage III sporulation protein AA